MVHDLPPSSTPQGARSSQTRLWIRKGCSSVKFSSSVLSDSLWLHEPQHSRPPCPSPTPGVHPNPCPSSWWCHPTTSSSVVPFSYFPQSFPASGSCPMSQLFASVGQNIGISASTSVLPMNTQDWSSLGWTRWISLQSKGLPRVFSSTTVQKERVINMNSFKNLCAWKGTAVFQLTSRGRAAHSSALCRGRSFQLKMWQVGAIWAFSFDDKGDTSQLAFTWKHSHLISAN